MKLIWILTRSRLEALFASMFNIGKRKRATAKKRSPAVTVLFVLLFLYVIAAMLFAAVAMSYGVATVSFDVLGKPWFYFTLLSVFSLLLMVFTGMFNAKSQIFEPKDNDLLLSMPIPPRAILISRMILLYLFDLMFELIFMIPAGIIYTFYAAWKPLGLIFYLFSLLLLPLFALAISSLLGWLLALLSSRCRNKTLPQTIVCVLFLGVYFFFVFRFQEIGQVIVAKGSAIADALKIYAYPLYAMGMASAEGHILQFLLFALVCLLPAVLCWLLLARSFIFIVTVNRQGKKLQYNEKKEAARGVRTPLWAFTCKEMRHFFGNTMYIMNAGIGLIFLPIVGVMLLVMKSDLLASLSELSSVFPISDDMLALFATLVGCVILSMTMISAPSVSLEGTNLWIALTAPVPGSLPLHAKSLAHTVICAPVIFVYSLLCVIALPMSPLAAIFVFLLPQVFSPFVALVGTLTNLRFPKFDWVDETIAIKQSMSVLLAMGIMTVSSLLLLGGAVVAAIFLPPVLIMAIVTVLLGGIITGLYFIEDKAGARAFPALANR